MGERHVSAGSPETEFRPMTERERAVLDRMLSVDFEGVAELRAQSASARVARTCACGCPSIDFEHPAAEHAIKVEVDATVDGTHDGLFLYTTQGWLGGIEWVGISERNPPELPDPSTLSVRAAP